MSELTSNSMIIRSELVTTACGLFANVQNGNFQPTADTVSKWAKLFVTAAEEIERVQGLILSQTKLNTEMWKEGYSAGKAAQQAYSADEPCSHWTDDPVPSHHTGLTTLGGCP
jgi:hypothetical protein